MNFKMLAMAAAVVGSMTAVGVARAQMHHGPMGPGMEFLHSLTLSEAQKGQLKAIGKANWESMKPLMKQERALHEQEINELLTSGSVTAEQMQPIMAQEESLRSQIDAARMAMLIQMRGVLTAEQLSEAATKHTQMEQLHEQEHALMGAGPEGPE
jgi:Spy/CpxP family protein refolding chaperone